MKKPTKENYGRHTKEGPGLAAVEPAYERPHGAASIVEAERGELHDTRRIQSSEIEQRLGRGRG